jgi:hypothetical protein
MDILEERLAKKGTTSRGRTSLVAKTKDGVIHVDPAGLCWSAVDPSDSILPAIPDLLAAPKERIPLNDLKAMYFRVAQRSGETAINLTTRLEASTKWDSLRAAGECGLAPDEHALASFILERTRMPCTMLTDFPIEGAVSRIFGRRRYYEGLVDSEVAASTLSKVGDRPHRSSFIERDCALRFTGPLHLSEIDLASLLGNLGEWCFFTPT